MKIRQESVERITVDGSYSEQVDAFARYGTGEWRLVLVGPKPTGGLGRYSAEEFRAVFERVVEEREVP